MKRTTAFLAVIAVCAMCSAVYAEYGVINEGAWPKSWPKELEPLRKQARTLVGPDRALVGPEPPYYHYLIPFNKRAEFEAAWPHLLKVKSKGAPIILLRGPKTDFFAIEPAGVLIHSHSPPPELGIAASDLAARAKAEALLPGEANDRRNWRRTDYIELVVDGKIVDLNRIPLPEDTPIIDERFKDEQKK